MKGDSTDFCQIQAHSSLEFLTHFQVQSDRRFTVDDETYPPFDQRNQGGNLVADQDWGTCTCPDLCVLTRRMKPVYTPLAGRDWIRVLLQLLWQRGSSRRTSVRVEWFP